MKVGLAVVILLSVGAVAAYYGWLQGEFTQCFAHFDSLQGAKRVAFWADVAGFDADVESNGPSSRRPSSPGGRGISVIFSDGETGEDAATFRRTFHDVVDREHGDLGHSGNGCLERPRVN